MKNKRHLVIPVVIIILIFSVSSCSLPFKIVPNVQTTLPPVEATTPPPSTATVQPPTNTAEATFTPTPYNSITLADLMPVSGSILKWIDLSDFVYVPGGEFVMGQDEAIPSDHSPAHKANLAGFWIQQAEVTNQQYAACVAAGKCTPPAKESDKPYWYSQANKVNNPVVGVTWLQATDYCTYIEGRLPTEAEWEKTARGTKDFIFPWGNDRPNCSLLNYDNCLDPSSPEKVRNYNNGASEYLAMDMSGNVFEWVNDWYADDYYPVSPETNPVGPVDGTKKVYRGGSYSSNMDDVNAIARFSVDPNDHAADLGFRCVLTGDKYNKVGGGQVPRPCSVMPVVDQPKMQATFTPVPCDPASITAYCHTTSKGQMLTGFTVIQSNCQYNFLSGFESNTIPDVNCVSATLVPDTSPKQYNCTGTNMVQGLNVDLFFWHDFMVSQIEKTCPAGFVLDSANSFCIPSGNWLPEPPCPYGYTEFEGVCTPNHSFQNGCPVGFYEISREISPNVWNKFCIPLDECLLQGVGANCSTPVCASGQTYDPSNNCCAVPEKLQQVCPVGLSLKVDPMYHKNYCEPVGDLLSYENRTVKIPYCATITPTPTPTLVPPSKNCSVYGDEKSCAANGCNWVMAPSGLGSCQ